MAQKREAQREQAEMTARPQDVALLHVAVSPLTNRIYAGSVLKDGQTWAANKTDVTGQACAAVAMHAIDSGGSVVVTAKGKPKWEITVKELAP